MHQPKGFVAKGKEDWVWQLNQTLYGLRQSSRVWYQKLRDALLELGFKPSAADPCVFIRSHDGNLSIVFTHVDDLGLICNSVNVVVQLKGELAKYFPISDLGEAHHLLGIKITRDREKRTIALSHTGYIEGFFKAENCKENVLESINTISIFCIPESVIKFRLSPRS